MRFLTSIILLFAYCTAQASTAEQLTAAKLEALRSQPKALQSFLKRMPKGGELHYHLAGGAYPETMFALANQSNAYCIDMKSNALQPKSACHGLPVSQIAPKSKAYHNMLQSWSMKDFTPLKESAHDHFFNAFIKFIPLVFDYRPQLLVSVVKRAARQHERYMELMILPDNGASMAYTHLIQGIKSNDDKRRTLLADTGFVANISAAVAKTKAMDEQAHQLLGCQQHADQPACQMVLRYQYYVLREQSPDSVFTQALSAFEAASRSKLIVGVNLVQAEDGPLSLEYYRQQMHIFSWLHQHYPEVQIALHAGELAPNLVKSEDLSFHIHDAIMQGGAARIGHGTDILHEKNALETLQYMHKKQIAVEVNLTSNQTILGIQGETHPLNTYLKHGVPVVLSTDDEGILRTNLTREYMMAVQQHGLTYPELKDISFNAIRYSFVDEASKKKLTRLLRQDFEQFEREVARYSSTTSKEQSAIL